jgi:hypothetical protein
MTSLEDLKLRNGDWTTIDSKLCSLGMTLWNDNPRSDLSARIFELVASYYNQWRFVLDSYDVLYKLFLVQMSKDTTPNKDIYLSKFDVHLVTTESQFRQYGYIFIISLKSLLDIFACIVDVIQNQQIRTDASLPDFKYPPNRKSFIVNDIPKVNLFFKQIQEPSDYPWIASIVTIRNKIVHRGFSLKPVIGFQKLENLVMQTYRGTDFYTDIDSINIGETLKMAVINIPAFEIAITNILLNEIPHIIPSLTHQSSYRYSELINEYNTKEI